MPEPVLDDRALFAGPVPPVGGWPNGGTPGSLLVDGFFRGRWRLTEKKGTARLEILGFTADPRDPAATADAIEDEARAMLAFLTPDAGSRELEF